MPGTNDPDAPVFYVYEYSAKGRIFYVGSGWTTRASDRVDHVERLMNRESKGQDVHWVNSNRVIRALKFEYGLEIEISYPVTGETQAEARRFEKEITRKRLQEGCMLANIVGNPRRLSTEQVIQYVLTGELPVAKDSS